MPAAINPGQTRVIDVDYRNTGTITAYHAQARLTMVDPFTSSDTMAYLGDMAPGQIVTAHYTITADSKAFPATYELDTDVRYRDSLDNSLTSDTFGTPIDVIPPVSGGSLPVLAILCLAAVILIGAGYCLVAMRRKR